jgi:hypothetical protein
MVNMLKHGLLALSGVGVVLATFAAPASAASFPIPGGGSCSANYSGNSISTTVTNVSCAQVQAYAYDYGGGGGGTSLYSDWAYSTAYVRGTGSVTSHGARVKIGTAVSAWKYF